VVFITNQTHSHGMNSCSFQRYSILFSVNSIKLPQQQGNLEESSAANSHQIDKNVYDFAEDGIPAANFYAEIQQTPQVEKSAVLDQCNVYDKISSSPVVDDAECYSKIALA